MYLLIVTGMSGAGKSQALNKLEDIGFYCVDNLPPNMVCQFIKEYRHNQELSSFAMGIDCRSSDIEEFSVVDLAEKMLPFGVRVESIFIDASDEVLIRRYSESRRNHPMARSGVIGEGIDKERKALEHMRQNATYYIDTSYLSPSQLYAEIEIICQCEGKDFMVIVRSFGFKIGMPKDADIVMDVRFLPNPFWNEQLRPFTGKDAPIIDYLKSFPIASEFIDDFSKMIERLIPKYKEQAKSRLLIAIGCTGGQHRSVFMAEKLAQRLKDDGIDVLLSHRDI